MSKAVLMSRRTLMGAAAGAGAALALPTLGCGAGDAAPPTATSTAMTPATASVPRTPVVTFHMDRPYLDLSGTAEAYIPPAGARSGQALAALSDEAFYSRSPY